MIYLPSLVLSLRVSERGLSNRVGYATKASPVAQMGALNVTRTSNAGPSLITVQWELTRLSWIKIDIYLPPVARKVESRIQANSQINARDREGEGWLFKPTFRNFKTKKPRNESLFFNIK